MQIIISVIISNKYKPDRIMKKLLVLSLIIFTLVSCSNTNQGELVGVRKQSKPFSHPDPYGMVFVPLGSYTMGVGGQDIASSQITQPKTISVSSFFMDETEITNNEYREFVYWVRDSIARKILSESENGEAYLITQNPKTGEEYFIVCNGRLAHKGAEKHPYGSHNRPQSEGISLWLGYF